MLSALTFGLDAFDAAQLVLRGGVGVAFAISGFNKLFHPHIHASLRRNLEMNKIPCIGFNEWWVPFWEFVAGITLVLGLFTASSAAILLIVCFVAFLCSCNRKVAKKNPINAMEAATEYLFLFDLLLIWMLIAIIFGGPGAYSLDNFLR